MTDLYDLMKVMIENTRELTEEIRELRRFVEKRNARVYPDHWSMKTSEPIDTRPDFHESANFDPPKRVKHGVNLYTIEENGDLVPVSDD